MTTQGSNAMRKRQRSARFRREAVFALLTLLFFVVAVSGGYILLLEAPHLRKSNAINPTPVGLVTTIKLAKEGVRCRHLSLDNATGRMNDNGMLPCDAGAVTEKGRLETIRESFKSR
jgi:hypothetical protein